MITRLGSATVTGSGFRHWNGFPRSGRRVRDWRLGTGNWRLENEGLRAHDHEQRRTTTRLTVSRTAPSALGAPREPHVDTCRPEEQQRAETRRRRPHAFMFNGSCHRDRRHDAVGSASHVPATLVLTRVSPFRDRIGPRERFRKHEPQLVAAPWSDTREFPADPSDCALSPRARSRAHRSGRTSAPTATREHQASA